LPCPQVRQGQLLIQVRASLISAGTGRTLVEFSQGNLPQEARSQLDKVKQALDKIKKDGLMLTLAAVFRKLDKLLETGADKTAILAVMLRSRHYALQTDGTGVIM